MGAGSMLGMPPIKRPCLDCRNLTENKSRCDSCESRRDSIRNASRRHYAGDYAKRAAAVRAGAVTCWICGLPRIEGDPWTADHVLPGDPNSPLLPAHRSCNSRRGDASGRQPVDIIGIETRHIEAPTVHAERLS